jgi:hypothetical protein
MENVTEAIAHYSKRKSSSELSISEIRSELTAQGKFSKAEISEICTSISDAELTNLNKEKFNPGSLANHPVISYVLTGLFAYLVYVAWVEVSHLSESGQGKYKIWGYFLLAGAFLFFLRNLFKVIKSIKRNTQKEQ